LFICGLNPNDQEIVYNDIAVKIAGDQLIKINDVIQILKGEIYPEDNEIKRQLRNIGFDM
jgi:hypothetical protein